MSEPISAQFWCYVKLKVTHENGNGIWPAVKWYDKYEANEQT